MRAGIVYFTPQGENTATKVKAALERKNFICEFRSKEIPLKEWTQACFFDCDLIVFVSATGIAVRTIAPYLVSKTVDPAVVVLDDKGDFVISLVSGHIGGGNDIARMIGEEMGSTPVITTSTDVNGKLAIDEWAVKNNMVIGDMAMAKKIAMFLLKGIKVGMVSQIDLGDNMPKDLLLNDQTDIGVNISWKRQNVFSRELKLIPKKIALGIGCKKDTDKTTIEKVVLAKLFEEDIDFRAIDRIGTIDIKKDEQGLIEFCRELDCEMITYTAKELEEAEGEFEPSDFVKSVTGTDNVCQRAATLVSNNGEILFEKFAKDGVTVSAAVIKGE
ncbi:MAG: cobalamin biosynthesis protein [Anaerovoracaceae bacterium]